MKINSSTANSLIFQIVDNMHDMFRVIDSDHNIIFMNKKMRETFQEYQEKKCYELLNGEKRCENCISEKCKNIEDHFSKDIELDSIFYRVQSSSMFSIDNNRYFVEIFQDITEEKKLERKILSHYHKMKLDIDFARQIQQNLLPENNVYANCLKLTSSYLPSEALGGDMFDLFESDENYICFYISDVSGHGIQSSLLTMFLRQIIRGMKKDAKDIPKAIEEIIYNYKTLHLEEEQYFSLIYSIYDIKKKEVSFINAGHNCPLIIIRKSGKIEKMVSYGMPICKLLDHFSHEITTFKVEEGDRLLLFTDGISESLDKSSQASETIFTQLLEDTKHLPSETLVETIVNRARSSVQLSAIDDIAFLVIDIIS